MEYRPDVPLIIMRRHNLTYNEKSFLLWCWINRDCDEYCILMSKEDCNKKSRNVTWYANYFGVPQQTMSDVFVRLKAENIIKVRDVNRIKETTYVNFTIFN